MAAPLYTTADYTINGVALTESASDNRKLAFPPLTTGSFEFIYMQRITHEGGAYRDFLFKTMVYDCSKDAWIKQPSDTLPPLTNGFNYVKYGHVA